MKILELNEKKCHQIHIGKSQTQIDCTVLSLHQEIVIKTEKDKYLGDILSSNGKNTANIKARTSIGLGIMSSIIMSWSYQSRALVSSK